MEPSDPINALAAYLEDLKRIRMPFGRYGPEYFPPAGRAIYELPLEYLVWFREQRGGFPKGRLGELMAFVCEVKSVGAGEIFAVLREN